MSDLIAVENLEKSFPVRGGLLTRTRHLVQAVRGVTLRVEEGETLGIVGESGCGKTTLGRVILRLIPPTSGQVLFKGGDVATLQGASLKEFRSRVQMIFQDPFASLNPRMTVGEIVAEPLVIHGRIAKKERRERVAALLRQVGLLPDHQDRYPHEFSGGQRQRIGIARAISLGPELIVADEPVSSLDVSVAFQILELLKELKGIGFLFIAHDLRMVRYMSRRIAVMYLGKIVELLPREKFDQPLHPYTRHLMAAVPSAKPRGRGPRVGIAGEVPSPVSPPAGCSFHPRCPFAEGRCKIEEPLLREWRPGHWAACHLVDETERKPL